MELIKELNVADFLNNNEEILLQHESQNNLMLGLADSILHSKRSSQEPLFYTIKHKSKICGQAIRTNPDKPLILSQMNKEILIFLADKLKEDFIKLRGVVGPINTAKIFASAWSHEATIGMHQGVYA